MQKDYLVPCAPTASGAIPFSKVIVRIGRRRVFDFCFSHSFLTSSVMQLCYLVGGCRMDHNDTGFKSTGVLKRQN